MSFDLAEADNVDWNNESEVKALYQALLAKHREHLRKAVIDSAYDPFVNTIKVALEKIESLYAAASTLEDLDQKLKDIQ